VTIEPTKSASDNKQKEIEIKNILVPIDGSDYSLNAVEYAIRIAKMKRHNYFASILLLRLYHTDMQLPQYLLQKADIMKRI
jgi:nucleotide-binding universal stress UspA family protein